MGGSDEKGARMNNRGEFNFTEFGKMILMISVISLGFAGFMGGMFTLFPTSNLEPDEIASYSKMVEIANLTDQLGGSIGSTSSSSDDFDVKIYKKGFASIKLVFYDGIDLIWEMLNLFSITIGLPAWFVGFIISLIVFPLALLLVTIFIRGFFKL